jgi:hypothetical protein
VRVSSKLQLVQDGGDGHQSRETGLGPEFVGSGGTEEYLASLRSVLGQLGVAA